MGNKGLRYAIRDGFIGILRHPMILIVSITTMFLMLTLLGAFLIFSINAHHLLRVAGEQPPIEVQFAIGTDEQTVRNLETELAANENVVEHKAMSPEENMEAFKARIGEQELFSDFDYAAHIPWTILLRLSDPSLGDAFREEVMKYPGVYDVMMETALMRSLEAANRNVSIVSSVLLIALLLITALIINNMIRIIALSRSSELAIMKLVGATDLYVRIPFMIEGLFISLVAALLSIMLLLFAYGALTQKALGPALTGDLLNLAVVALPVIALVLSVGLLVGLVTSYVAVKRYIRV